MSPVIRWGLFWLCGLCAGLATIIAWESGERRWLALATTVVAGAYLGVLVPALLPKGQARARSGRLLERLQGVPDWAVRLVGGSGAAAMFAGLLLRSRFGFAEFFAPASVAGWALMGLMFLAGPRPFRFRRR